MTKFIFSLSLALTCITGFAQEKDANIIMARSQKSDLYFHRYSPYLKVTADYSSMDQAVNLYPEQLIRSVLSARNQDWVNHNTLGGGGNATEKDQAHFDRVAVMDKEKNYFLLHHKVTFSVGTIPTALIKFFFYQEGKKPISGCMMAQKVDGRWYKASHPSFSLLSIIFMRLKTDVLEGVALGNSGSPGITELRGRVTTNGSLDLQKLETEFSSWYRPVIDQKKIQQYKDPYTW